jgi:hypothetical protein
VHQRRYRHIQTRSRGVHQPCVRARCLRWQVVTPEAPKIGRRQAVRSLTRASSDQWLWYPPAPMIWLQPVTWWHISHSRTAMVGVPTDLHGPAIHSSQTHKGPGHHDSTSGNLPSASPPIRPVPAREAWLCRVLAGQPAHPADEESALSNHHQLNVA